MNQSRTKTLLKETGWFAIGNFGSKILSLLLVPIYTSILSTNDYGIADILINTISLAIPLLTLSVQDAAFRFAFDENKTGREVFSGCMMVTLLSPIILVILYPLISKWIPSIAEYLIYFILIYVFNSISTTTSCFIKGIGKTRVFAIQGIIYTFAFAMSNIIFLVFIKLGIEGYLLSFVIANAVSCIYMLFAVKLWTFFSVKSIKKNVLVEMLKYSIPLVSASVAWWVMTSIDRYMLIAMCDASANGLYSVAHKLPTILSVLTTFFINAWQISAVRNKDDEDIDLYTTKVFNLVFIFGSVLCFGMIGGSEILGHLMFQKDFFAAWTMTPCLSVATVFSTFSLFWGAQFTAEKRSDLHLKSNLLAMIVNVILNYVWIKSMGINGAAYGTMISYFVVLIYRQIKVDSLFGYKVNSIKMYAVCTLLIVTSVVSSFGTMLYYPVTVASLIVSLLLYKNECTDVIKKLRVLIKRK